MLKDITLGQYFPGDTVVHRLDPRTKLLMVIVYIVALFLAKWVVSYAVMLAFLVTAVALSRIRPRALFKGLKPLLFIIIFTAIINVFYTKGDVLVQFWIFKITREGLVNAGFLVLRIVMLVTGTFLLTYTTSPIALTDGLESLLSPLKAIHFPVHELALMMSIALRFIPTLIEETDKIISAQKARGKSVPPRKGPCADPRAAVHQRVPARRRAGHGHGVPLLPRRLRPHEAEAAPLSASRYSDVCARRCRAGRRHRPAELWTVTAGRKHAESRTLSEI